MQRSRGGARRAARRSDATAAAPDGPRRRAAARRSAPSCRRGCARYSPIAQPLQVPHPQGVRGRDPGRGPHPRPPRRGAASDIGGFIDELLAELPPTSQRQARLMLRVVEHGTHLFDLKREALHPSRAGRAGRVPARLDGEQPRRAAHRSSARSRRSRRSGTTRRRRPGRRSATTVRGSDASTARSELRARGAGRARRPSRAARARDDPRHARPSTPTSRSTPTCA